MAIVNPIVRACNANTAPQNVKCLSGSTLSQVRHNTSAPALRLKSKNVTAKLIINNYYIERDIIVLPTVYSTVYYSVIVTTGRSMMLLKLCTCAACK